MRAKDRRRRALPVPDERRRSVHERREHERVLVNFEVDYRCNDPFLFAYITDLSAMGIFVQTATPLAAGTQLNLHFRPPGGQEMDIEGRVIWVNRPRTDGSANCNPGMGVQFVDLTPLQREQILGLIRTFAYLPDDDDDVILGNS
jgi:type IV pilus assembly protein PilZ